MSENLSMQDYMNIDTLKRFLMDLGTKSGLDHMDKLTEADLDGIVYYFSLLVGNLEPLTDKQKVKALVELLMLNVMTDLIVSRLTEDKEDKDD